MSATKVVMIILALIAVLFVVLVLRTPRGGPTESADSFNSEEHPTLDSMNSVLGRFAPKLSVKALSPRLQTFDLSTGNPTYTVAILPDASHKFRQAAFTAMPSKHCAQVTYTPANPNEFDKGKTQDSESSGSRQHPNQFSFTVFSGGGTLHIGRSFPAQAGLCILALQVAQ